MTASQWLGLGMLALLVAFAPLRSGRARRSSDPGATMPALLMAAIIPGLRLLEPVQPKPPVATTPSDRPARCHDPTARGTALRCCGDYAPGGIRRHGGAS